MTDNLWGVMDANELLKQGVIKMIAFRNWTGTALFMFRFDFFYLMDFSRMFTHVFFLARLASFTPVVTNLCHKSTFMYSTLKCISCSKYLTLWVVLSCCTCVVGLTGWSETFWLLLELVIDNPLGLKRRLYVDSWGKQQFLLPGLNRWKSLGLKLNSDNKDRL